MRYANKRKIAGLMFVLLTGMNVEGCTSDTHPIAPEKSTIARLEAVTPLNLTATVGTIVTPAPAVKVIGTDGNPKGGIEVVFYIHSPHQRLTRTALSGIDGVATLEWEIGPAAGPNMVTAAVPGATGVFFTVTGVAGPLARIDALFGNGQLGLVGSGVNGLAVQTRDAYGNAVADVNVTFAIIRGGGSIGNAVVKSSASGYASSGAWILGAEGENVAMASALGVSSPPFTATGMKPGMGGISATYILQKVDGEVASVRAWSGSITLSSDGSFVAESRFDCCGKSTTYRGGGKYAISAGNILLNVQTGDWLQWANTNPVSGNQNVAGVLTGDGADFSWYVEGPDYDTKWTYLLAKP